jgi:hypothetical protein
MNWIEARKEEILSKLRDFFEENYEYMKEEGGHMITDYTKELAFQQIKYYFLRNYELIERITDAEVKLTLPQQLTPIQEIPYTIEGVIDIVQEEGRVWMYDLKSHDLESIESNLDFYKQQLNIYAYIWKNLRGRDLDNTAVISTPLPRTLKLAIQAGEEKHIRNEMKNWNPIVPLGYSEDEVEAIIESFGEVVEKIEDSDFAPPPVKKLQERRPGERVTFGVRVCRNCDVRFSCDSFREYALRSPGRNQTMQNYLDDYGTEVTKEEYIEGNLDHSMNTIQGEE